MSHPYIRSGQWSQTTTGISQPAARLKALHVVNAKSVSTYLSQNRKILRIISKIVKNGKVNTLGVNN